MELTFIRHAESEFNHLGVFQGRLNCSLSKDGIMQTREKAKSFDSSLYDICFSSPLIRTLQTSRILVPDLPLVCDDRIIERNLGDYYVSVKFHNSFRKFSGASHFNYNIWGLGVVNVKSVDALGGFDVINV